MKKRLLIGGIILAIFFLFCCICSVIFIFVIGADRNASLFNRFNDIGEKKDARALAEKLCSDRSILNKENLSKEFKRISGENVEKDYFFIEKTLKSCTEVDIKDETVDFTNSKTVYSFKGQLKLESTKPKDFKIDIIKEDGSMKIQYLSIDIF